MTVTRRSRIGHERALELAAAALDFPLPPGNRELLEVHLAGCHACREAAQALRDDAASVARLSATGRPSDRVLLAIVAAAVRPRHRGLRPVTALAAAAIVLVALGGGVVGGSVVEGVRQPLGVDPGRIAWARLATDGTLGGRTAAVAVRAIAPVSDQHTIVVAGGSVGGDAAIWTSTDEVRWWRVSPGQLGRGRIDALATMGPRIVAVGSRVDGRGLPSGRAWTSIDAISWATIPLDRVRALTAVAATPGRVVAAGIPRTTGDPAIWLSTDGRTWAGSDSRAFDGAVVTGLQAAGPGFVAVGYDDRGGAIWVSVDGRDWERVADRELLGRARILAVADTPRGIVAVGWVTDDAERPSPAAWLSEEGHAWSRSQVADAADGSRLSAVVASPYGIVAAGTADGHPAGWLSVDASTWLPMTGVDWATADELSALAVHGEHLLAAAFGPDGATLWAGTAR